jgi:hypothetical protein
MNQASTPAMIASEAGSIPATATLSPLTATAISTHSASAPGRPARIRTMNLGPPDRRLPRPPPPAER